MADLDRIPLSGLRAVEAVARLGSLARAADELAVTPGAVSQRIAKTEALIGRPLFDRLPGGMVPNDLGAAMLVPLSRAMADLAQTVEIATTRRRDTLIVSAAPVFASRWLVWRLGQFQDAHGDLRIRVEPSVPMVNPLRDDVDICLRVGDGNWPGLEAEKLVDYHLFPVCSPAVAQRLRAIGDLPGLPIIHEFPRLPDWALWLDGTGLGTDRLRHGPSYADAGLCIDAAIAGQGVFLGWELIAQDALGRGTLVEPLAPRRVRAETGLWFVTAPGAGRRAPVRQFRDWLRGQLGPLAAA